MSVIGFDIGCSKCCIGIARQGGVEIILNEESDRFTPSYVSFTGNQRLIGTLAKQQLAMNPKNVVTGLKNLLGRKFNDPLVTKEREFLPCELAASSNGFAEGIFDYNGSQQHFSTVQLMAMLLSKLKDTAEKALGLVVNDCVISVPCYYTDHQRRAMLDASKIAGLNCLKLMNDTAAVALNYGLFKSDLPEPEAESKYTAFVDVGYSDTQISVCAFNKGKVKVLNSSYDPNLGGRDFDMVIFNYAAEQFKQKTKLDVKTRPRSVVRLMNECEKVKKLMSTNSNKNPLSVECLMEERDLNTSIARAQFEEQAAGLLERFRGVLEDCLKNCGVKADQISEVEIIGGATRIPAFKELIKTVFAREASTTLNADESVARGSAVQCAILSPNFRVRDFSVQDAQLFPIYLEWDKFAENEEAEMEIFPRLHQIPFSKLLTFYRTKPFSLYAQYSYPNELPYTEHKLGVFTVNDVKPTDDGSNMKVKVKLRVNKDGIFTLADATAVEKYEVEVMEEEPKKDEKPAEAAKEGDAMDQDAAATEPAVASVPAEPKMKTKTRQTALPVSEVVPQLANSELNQLVEVENAIKATNKMENDRVEAKNNVEEYMFEMKRRITEEYSKFIPSNDAAEFSKLLDATDLWLYDEGEDQIRQVYVDQLNKLKAFGDPVRRRAEEAEKRPTAFENLGASLQRFQKVTDAFDAGNEAFAHLDPKDVDKVKDMISKKRTWFDENLNKQNSLALTVDPIVRVSEIDAETRALEAICNPIVTKSKPKPPPPPKEEKPKAADPAKANGEPESNGDVETPVETKEETAAMDMD